MIYSLKKGVKKVQRVYLRAKALNPNRKPAGLWAARVHSFEIDIATVSIDLVSIYIDLSERKS